MPGHPLWTPLILLAAMLLLSALSAAARNQEITLQLALELSAEGNTQAAALELRRLSLMAAEPEQQAGYAWAAAHEYGRADSWETADNLLNRAEQHAPQLEMPVLLLRAESAAAQRNLAEADFYFQIIRDNPRTDADLRRYAARRGAVMLTRMGDTTAAEQALATVADEDNGLAALEHYRQGRDKKPMLGGLLGIIPGLGYAYAGEYANALRSAILNGLFIFGMVHTAQHDQWGAFAAISFFEVTWYSGSIYGGLDATHRFNRRRQQSCLDGIMGQAAYSPDFKQLPLISLQFEF
ncbi:MAG: hypothetical protein ABR497_02910 [Kiritimatiellia bacterium]